MPSADFCSAVRRPLRSPQSPVGDTKQTSRGKLNRVRCTTAGSTLCVLDGYGLRDQLPARPTLAPRIRFLFIGSHLCSTLPFRPRLTAVAIPEATKTRRRGERSLTATRRSVGDTRLQI